MTLTPIRCPDCNGKSIEAQRTYTIHAHIGFQGRGIEGWCISRSREVRGGIGYQ